MKKIDIKKTLTSVLMAVMVLIQALITSVPVYASETSSTVDWWKDITSKSIYTSEVFVYHNTYDNKYYDTTFAYLKTSAPVYSIVFTHPVGNYYAYDYVLLSEEPFTFKTRQDNDNYDKFDKDSFIEKALSSDSHDSAKADFMGKTFYTAVTNTTGDKGFKGSVLYDITGIQNCYGISQILPYIYQKGGNFDYVSGLEGEFDKTLGYLHGLEYEPLVEWDEETGAPTESWYRFKWEKYYDDYDESYQVEIYGICNVEVRNFFGLGKSKKTASERKYIKTVPYITDGSGFAEITNTEMNAIFKSDWNVGNFTQAVAWNYDFYFRIYKDGKYGPWTIWQHDKGPLTGDDTGTTWVGEEDENGNIKKDSDTEYGEGISKDPNSGAGTSKDDALDSITGDHQFDPSDFSQWFKWLYDCFKSFIDTLGQFPKLLGNVFTFLPPQVTVFLCAILIVCVILRLLGR